MTLIARGLKTPNTIRRAYDVNPGFGGPIRKDKVWFYLAARFASTSNYVGSLFENKNAGDPTKFLYEPDTARRAFNQTTSEGVNARVTWQLNSTNKLAFFHDQQWRCTCSDTQPTSTSEASSRLLYPVQTMSSVSWTSTPTNRLLIDVGTGLRRERYVYGPPPGQPILAGVTELGGLIPGLRYRGSVTATRYWVLDTRGQFAHQSVSGVRDGQSRDESRADAKLGGSDMSPIRTINR
jgi:hypothetical protein